VRDMSLRTQASLTIDEKPGNLGIASHQYLLKFRGVESHYDCGRVFCPQLPEADNAGRRCRKLRRPLNLSAGKLFAVKVPRVGFDEHIGGADNKLASHPISAGWSMWVCFDPGSGYSYNRLQSRDGVRRSMIGDPVYGRPMFTVGSGNGCRVRCLGAAIMILAQQLQSCRVLQNACPTHTRPHGADL